jgi:hypothetical protein
MSFTRTRLPGFWTFGSAVLPGEFEHIDDYAYAIDGKAGGTYAPTGLITIGGLGLTVSGPFIASDADTIDVNGALTINGGAQLNLNDNMVVGTGAVVGFTSGSFLTVSNGATVTFNAGSTVTFGGAISFTAGVTLSGAVTMTATGSLTTAVGSSVTFNGSLAASTNASFTNGITVTRTSANTSAVTATGNGIGSGINCTGGASGPGMTAAPGTASTSILPQCAARLGGHIEITADDPDPTVAPPGGTGVLYGLSGARAYCSVVVGGGGPYAPEDSHNIDVVDDVALGNYSVTFLTPMASNKYAVVLTSSAAGIGVNSHSKTVNGFSFTVYDTNTKAAIATVTTIDFMVFGRR